MYVKSTRTEREARDENVPAKRSDFFNWFFEIQDSHLFGLAKNLFDFSKYKIFIFLIGKNDPFEIIWLIQISDYLS